MNWSIIREKRVCIAVDNIQVKRCVWRDLSCAVNQDGHLGHPLFGSGFAESSQGVLPGSWGLEVLWGPGEHLMFMMPHDTAQAPTGFPRFVRVLILTLNPDVVATSSGGPREQRFFNNRLHPRDSPSQAGEEEQRWNFPKHSPPTVL